MPPKTPMKSVCVYCGARSGAGPVYADSARKAGHTLAEQGISLVYGAGTTGMMGAIANGVLEAGGEVIGVIPRGLHRHEQTHVGLSTLHIVDTMHERKALMEVLSDGLIALPGGYGTLDEMFEALTWAVLGIHKKPCAFLNVQDYWTPLLKAIDHMTSEEFMSQSYRDIVLVDDDFSSLLDKMRAFTSPLQPIWHVDEDTNV